jgi:peptide chain release factor 3
MLVLFSTPWRLEGFQRDNPNVKLGSLVAAEGVDSIPAELHG